MSNTIARYDTCGYDTGMRATHYGNWVRYSDVAEHVMVQTAAFYLMFDFVMLLCQVSRAQAAHEHGENLQVPHMRIATDIVLMRRRLAWLRGES